MMRSFAIAILQILVIAELTSALPPRKRTDHSSLNALLKEITSWTIREHSVVCAAAASHGSTTCGRGLKITVEDCGRSCTCSASGTITCLGNDDCTTRHLESFCNKLCICSSPPLTMPEVLVYSPRVIKGNLEIDGNHRASSHLYLGEPGDYYDDEEDEDDYDDDYDVV